MELCARAGTGIPRQATLPSSATRGNFRSDKGQPPRRIIYTASRRHPRSRHPWRSAASNRLQRLQVLDEIALLAGGQCQALERVVVRDDVRERCESAVVVEAALLMRPQAA